MRKPPPLHPERLRMAWINVLGGTAVLWSYVHGIVTHPDTRGDVWGGVPESWIGVYAVSMVLAAAGYFAFAPYLFFRVDPDRARAWLWAAVRIDLAVVGLASVGLVAALWVLSPREAGWRHPLAVAGSLAFTFQTAVLDALVWPLFFPFS